MRLNYKTFPIWQQLESGKNLKVHSKLASQLKFDDSKAEVFFRAITSSSVSAIKNNTSYLTSTFRKAILKAAPKIVASNNQDYLEKQLESGVILADHGGTLVYAENMKGLKLMMIGFDREKVVAFGMLDTTDFSIVRAGDEEWVKNYSLGESDHDAFHQWFMNILITYYFINYCDIEIKELTPVEKKYKSATGGKYMNESKTNVRILDCTWFTTLVNGDTHQVEGFYRWQPYGKLWSKRKLIFVESFERNTVIRIARAVDNRGPK